MMDWLISSWRTREGGREGGRKGGVGEKSDYFFGWKVGRYGCQNDGLDEADTMGRVRRREGGRERGREGGRAGGLTWSLSSLSAKGNFQ